MRVQDVQHSPLPTICDIHSTRLILSVAERTTLRRAAEITNRAEHVLLRGGHVDETDDLRILIANISGGIEELLEHHHIEGIRLP